MLSAASPMMPNAIWCGLGETGRSAPPWLEEAESRMAAYRSGELGAVDAEQVFAELGKKV